MKVYCGIDPGLSGAWAMITFNGRDWSCGDMHHDDQGFLHSERIWDEMRQARDSLDIEVVIEKVHSMPKQGVASTFKFGMAFGSAVTISKRFKREVTMVTPQVWKKSFKLSSAKQESLDLARQMFPEAPLNLKKHNGRAEALLIAEWLRRSNET